MLNRGKKDRDQVEFVVIDQLVPENHLLRKIDVAVDFNRLYEMVEPLYCEDNGRLSITHPEKSWRGERNRGFVQSAKA